MYNKARLVRQTCSWVHSQAKHVSINLDKLHVLADQFTPLEKAQGPYQQTPEQQERSLLQLFMLHFMNFCFWPLEEFEFDQLNSSVRHSVEEGISLEQLQKITGQDLINKVFKGVKVPLADARARNLRELATVVNNKFQGSLVNLIVQAKNSAVALLNLLTENFMNLQDHSIYKGHQVHFYKRAQILIGFLYNKYRGEGLGCFQDIQELTMYPDYRVPQVFVNEGVFEYSQELKQIIQRKEEITDRVYEVQIRASLVVAVELMKQYMQKKGINVLSIELDYFLWRRGQDNLKQLPPHHRCLTIYY